MKKLFFLFLLAAGVVVLTNTGCEDETIVDPIAPTLAFRSDDPTGVRPSFPTSDFDSETTGFVYVAVNVIAGSSNLKTLTVYEDGNKLATDRISLRDLNSGDDVTVQNPLLLLGDYVNGFDFEIGLDLQDDISTKAYTVEVEDENGQIQSLTINISTIDPGTPIEMTLEGVLLNQAGPAGQGGLDLDDGSSTGTLASDPTQIDGEINDEGIDLALPPADNWKRQISAMNDAEMRIPGASFPVDFNFGDVSTKEEIQAFFDGGDPLPNPDGGELISDPVEIGDIFFVKRGSKYYLLEVTDVVPTTSDNSDKIVFDVKY